MYMHAKYNLNFIGKIAVKVIYIYKIVIFGKNGKIRQKFSGNTSYDAETPFQDFKICAIKK